MVEAVTLHIAADLDHGRQFSVNGIPKGQPRPRAFARKMGGKFVARVFDAGTAEEWKSLVAAAARPHMPESPWTGPVTVWIAFLLPRPKRLCRKKDADEIVACASKPDADNLAKAVLDAMTQMGWWLDDAQVCSLHISKHYHKKTGRPGATVTVQHHPEAQT